MNLTSKCCVALGSLLVACGVPLLAAPPPAAPPPAAPPPTAPPPTAPPYDPARAAADYDTLLKWKCSLPQTLSAPVSIVIDTATFVLESGTVRLGRPVAGGRVTGLVFSGAGRFTMRVPDPVERTQLARFTRTPIQDGMDQRFTDLVLRASDDTIDKLFPHLDDAAEPCPLFEERASFWIEKLWDDVDSRIVAGLVDPARPAVAADVKTADFGWLTYRYVANDDEEISLSRFYNGYHEHWISLDRPQDRGTDGRPGAARSNVATIEHIDVKADLTHKGRTARIGLNSQETINGHYLVEETLVPVVDGLGALRLELASAAQNLKVSDDKGQPVLFLRDHIGARSSQIDNRYWDHGMLLLLAEPLARGTKRTLRFEYDLETGNYGYGNLWYPTLPGDIHEGATARLELKVSKKTEVRSMGRLDGRTDGSDGSTTVWIVDKPAKMLTFVTADHIEEVKIEVPNIPPIIAFSPAQQFGMTAKVRNVAADVANSMQFFQLLFDDRIDAPQMYVTSIAAGHGQAFDGLLHLSEYTFTGEHPGASELFRAHEVAHEWWGHKVGWKSYRDQWLSEAFAEYSAMMFVERFVKGGDKYFGEILDCYQDTLNGSLQSAFSKFLRPWLLEVHKSHHERVGPIALGQRASTYDMPGGYQMQTYVRGPLVLHMLRMLLRYKTMSDDLFVKILRDFEHEYAGKDAGTADFRRIVERDAPGDWSFFFNDWIDHAEIPRLDWDYKVAPAAGGGFSLDVVVKRSGTAPDFWMPIPVMVVYDGGGAGVFFVMSHDAESTTTLAVPQKPAKVILAPEHSVLAVINRL